MVKSVLQIEADGSDRLFFRINWRNKRAIKIIPSRSNLGLLEAQAFFNIGKHLLGKGIPVPEIYFFNKKNGELIVEDFGDLHLQDLVNKFASLDEMSPIEHIYKKTIDSLLLMQLKGADGFNVSWCWQSYYYDAALAVEKEVKYFLASFVMDFLDISYRKEVVKELIALAKKVDELKFKYFLHRDFQSRNILICNNQPKIIDFQAGRLGPLGYDLASLLYDPYVNIRDDIKKKCFDYYIAKLKKYVSEEVADEVTNSWSILCILRLLQALGAYGFLIKKRQKKFFKPYIRPAVKNLLPLLKASNLTYTLELFETIREKTMALN